MSFRVGPATRADRAEIGELCSRFAAVIANDRSHDAFDPTKTSASIAPLLEDDRFGVVLLAECDDVAPARRDLVGYLVLTWGYSLESGGREALIDEVYAEPRGLGTGSALLSAAVTECERRGIGRMFLETEAVNEGARRLYLRQGFEVNDSIWMSRWISKP
ncbi:MAG: GNAT family N-acetyltransferase [Actinomycetota bacterium]|nr:GNAT family N-acetyltransferase [Actinomycetota bacterium]